MIQVYADRQLVYDSRLDGYELSALSYTASLQKAGTATLTMPPGHPAYDYFKSYTTVVTIYKDDELLFRGRALYPTDDFYNFRTITCEGELNFFRDGVHRPYVYQDGPAAILAQVVELYNAQVEAYKQFDVGTVTVTDPNNYIRIENSKAEQFSDTLNKLRELCGGYFVITQSGTSSRRVLNWYAELEYRTRQAVEFGENLLDYARTGGNSDLVTVVIPYGAKIEPPEEETTEDTEATEEGSETETTGETGERLTVESVNEGRDYVQDYDAVARYGVIARAVYWDDVTEPANLLARAQKYLHENKSIITTLELSALDLSRVDVSMDSMQVGDLVRVRSKPHGVDEDFLLTDRTEDLLHPENSKVTLGKEAQTLTGADAAGDYKNAADLQAAERQIVADYKVNTAAAVQEAQTTLASMIQQTSEALRLEVSEMVMTGEEVQSLVSTSMEQLAESFTFTFTELQTTIDANDAAAREQFETLQKYIRFEGGDIILGEVGNELTLRIENDRISFLDAGAEVAYLNNQRLYVTDGHFLHSLRVGNIAAVPRANGNLSIVKVVE